MDNLNGKNLLIIGDSIMYGAGNHGIGVGEFLQKDFGLNLLKYCVGGARVGYYEGKDWVVDQVKRAICDGIRADLIVFDGFTNDCFKTDGINCDVPLGEISDHTTDFDIFSVKRENSTFSNCFENILAAFRQYFPEAKILFVRPHRMGRREETLQVLYGERAVMLCKKWGIPVADIYRDSDMDTFNPNHRDLYTNDSYGWGKGDSTHPNERGYLEKYMPIIERAIKNL